MTGRVHSFESFGTVDGPGIRFVLFLQGCPMRCKYCHNPDTWDRTGGREMSAEEVCRAALRYRSYFTGGGGVTVSGGEPLLQRAFLVELFTLLKGEGVHTCIDTSGAGFIKDDLWERLASLTDLFLVDVKHIDPAAHRALTGCSDEGPRALLADLDARGKPVWIRHVLVPGITDDDGALMRLRAYLDTFSCIEKIEVLPYHTMGEVKYQKLGIEYPLAGVKPPTRERVENARRILRAGKYGEKT